MFDSETQAFWVAPRPKTRVVWSTKSCRTLTRFLSVMSPEESEHFAKTTPENIIPTNMLDKWKLQDDGPAAAKSTVGKIP